jgi:prepilin-type N-terminal cleavage/methylation domain-containing protein/prepilin-type processing-associated H-X9-DG protein
MNEKRSRGFSLIELITVIGLISILMGLLLPAIQAARESSRRMSCQNKIRQLLIAVHNHESTNKYLPIGAESPNGKNPGQTWLAKILPYLEQNAIYSQSQAEFAGPLKHEYSKHTYFSTPMHSFACPNDPRTLETQEARGKNVALTSYLGNSGRSLIESDGPFMTDRSLRFRDLIDGLANTTLIVERPASADRYFGWWYAGAASSTVALDSMVGFEEQNQFAAAHVGETCMPGPYHFRSSNLRTQCGIFHPWSLHADGANMGFADGATRFVPYSADNNVLVARSTRNGGEIPNFEE